MRHMIQPSELQSKRTVSLARNLLGKYLVRRGPDGTEHARMIVETEAYCGESDLASHARAGRTKRTEVMYGAGGVWYVYLCYGIHEMLNLVVGPRDWPAAILIRGVEGAIGPGRVTKALDIDRRLNAQTVAPASGLWLEDRGVRVPRGQLETTPRIGIDYAGPIWSSKHWRFRFIASASSPLPSVLPPRRAIPAPVLAATRGRAARAAPTWPDRSAQKATG